MPTRWALLGGVIAMIVVAATLTFGSSLQTLVSQPRLYGWNWDYAVQSSDGYGPVPNQAMATLSDDRIVIASSGVWFATLQLDGVEVPVLLANPDAPVSPPIVQGHGLRASNQIVLGAATLAQLHKQHRRHRRNALHPDLSGPPDPPCDRRRGHHARHRHRRGTAHLDGDRRHRACRQRAADRAARPRGLSRLQRSEHGPSSGSRWGRISRWAGGRTAARHFGQRRSCPPKPRIRTAGATRRRCSRCNARPRSSTTAPWGRRRSCSRPDSPSEPWWPSGWRSLASVRRRRGDLALLKMLGFTQRQLASAIAWQASIAAVVGIVVGIPLGVALGRWLWTLFAQEIGAVPAPTRAGVVGGSRRVGRHHPRQRRGGVPGSKRRTDADGAGPARRVVAISRTTARAG